MIDVLIVGGGPTGLAAAIHAAKSGLEAVVLEPRPGCIDKACGEGLMPAGVAALTALGVTPPAHYPFQGIRYRSARFTADATFSSGPGWGIRRIALHEALRQRAQALGVRTLLRRVTGVLQDEQGVKAADLRARYLIAADGLRSTVRHQLGLDRRARWPARNGVRRHFHINAWSDRVEVHWSRYAEAYVTPVAPDLVSVAILQYNSVKSSKSCESAWKNRLQAFPELAARLNHAEPASAVRGAGPFAQRAARRVAGRVLLVGDAAGYLDPITGEGLKLGFAGAEAAVRAIVAGQPHAWEAEWWRLTRDYRWLTGGLLMLASNPALRPLIVPIAAQAPWLMRAVVDTLAGHPPAQLPQTDRALARRGS